MPVSITDRKTRNPAPALDGQLRLSAEVDWLVEGESVDIDAIAAALPGECVERYGAALVLRFGNAVGFIDAGPLGLVEVRSGKWGEDDFANMLRDITTRMSVLPFAAGSGASLPYDRSIAAEPDVLYHAFVYLRHILGPTAPQDERLMPALRVIVSRPHRGLERVFHWTPLEQVRRVDARSLLGVVTPRARLSRTGPQDIPLARALSGHLPEAMEESRTETTLDLAENQFVKAFLDQALGIIAAMRKLALARRPGGFPARILADCETLARELAPIRQHGMWREVSEMRRLPGDSQVLQRRRGYKEVFRHFIRLRLACRLPFRNAARMLEIKDIAELYEMWCFFEVERQITAVLGRAPTEAQTPDTNDFTAHLAWGLRVAWSPGIELFYNLSFSRSQAKHRRSYSVPLRPDIVLRIPAGPSAGDHIFDAKFKVRSLGDAVPSNDEQVDDAVEADERRGIFKQADLYKMHTYRDALPTARTVWILYPGSELRFFDLVRGRIDEANEVGHGADGVGAVALVPEGGGTLGTVLRGLLRY